MTAGLSTCPRKGNMPDVCVNTLAVTGPVSELDRFVRTAEGVGNSGEKQAFCLQSLYPMPDHLNTGLPVGHDEESWYAWCCRHWGTKWDVWAVTDVARPTPEKFSVTFSSAWASPMEAFRQRIAPDFPALTFRLRYADEGLIGTRECLWTEGKPVYVNRLVFTWNLVRVFLPSPMRRAK